ncbi:MAG: TonB-dependent receptor [Bacteroidales bacterium]|nr:TonB-dependent receptor [Bacteroidales bacterium]
MRHVLLLLMTISAMAFSAMAQPTAKTLKSQMEFLHDEYGVNFVYDSSLDLTKPYQGRDLSQVAKENLDTQDKGLEICLKTLFSGTNIEYEIMKKYIVLTQADKKKKPKDYTIFIEQQHDTINEAVITALTDKNVNRTQTGLEKIDAETFRRSFAVLSSPDVLKTLQQLPGVASGTELLSGMYVRGGDGADNLYLMDGVPMYQVSHLLGLFSSFNSDVVESVDFYKSGFPARYGGRMSSVVDVKTREGDFNKYHGLFSIGLLDGRLQFEGPIWKDRTSFNIGLRRSWIDVLAEPICLVISALEESRFRVKYAFWDLNANVTHKFSDSNKLALNLYGGRDAAKLIAGNDRHPSDDYSSKYMTRWGLEWGNFVASLDWDYKFASNHETSLKAYYTLYDSLFGLNDEGQTIIRDIDDGTLIRDEEYYSSTGNKSRTSDVGLKADFSFRPVENHHLRYGASLKYHFYNPVSYSVKNDKLGGETIFEEDKSQSAPRQSFESALYIEDEMSLTDWFTANVGLRYSAIATEGKWYHSVEPRAALRFQCGDYTDIRLSYSEMSQNSHLISSTYVQLPTSFWMPSTPKIAPSRSRQVAGGVHVNFPHNIKFGVEGYFKTMSNLLEFRGKWGLYPPITMWEDALVVGKGRSWGAETSLAWSNDKTSVEAYYTLSWSRRYFPDFYSQWYKDRNDNRHKLTLTATHRFGKRFEMYASWNYHSGGWMTGESHGIWDGEIGGDVETFYGAPNNLKVPDYHRLDIGFNFHKTTKRGNESIWNLSFYNAYCRMNPIASQIEKFYDFTPENIMGLTYYGAGYGLIPIIPSFSYTLKF